MEEKSENKFNVYWINLENCLSRKNNMEEFFNKYDISNTRVSAVDGNNTELIDNIVLFKDNIKVLENRRGQLGCLLSHLLTIKNFYLNDPNDYCLILEDDIDFEVLIKYNLDFNKTIQKIVKECKESWDIIQLSYTVRNNSNFKTNIENLYIKWAYKHFGTIAYLINKEGALKIINNYFKKDKILIDLTTHEKNVFCVSDYLIYKDVNTYTYKIPIFKYNNNFASVVGSSKDSQKFGIKMLNDSINFYNSLLQIYPKNSSQK